MSDKVFVPLLEWINLNAWPFAGVLPDSLDNVFINPPSFIDPTTEEIDVGFLIFTSLPLHIPGLDFLTIALGPASGSFEFDLTIALNPLSISLSVPVDLLIDANILRPLKAGTNDPDLTATTLNIPLGTINLSIDHDGNLGLDMTSVVSIPRCMIGTTGVILGIGKLEWIAPATPANQLPPNTPTGFTGLFFDNVEVDIPQLPAAVNKLGMNDVFLGTGGFSGKISRPGLALQWNGSSFSGDMAGELLGFQGGITGVSVEFRQNALVGCEIDGDVFVPYLNKRVGLTLGLDGQGDITATAGLPRSTPPETGVTAGGMGYLLHLNAAGVLGLDISALQFVAPAGGLPQLGISGRVTPSFTGLTFPPVDVKGLFIDIQGHIHIQGGWLNLPNQYHLNFYGFTIEIEKLGFGNTSDGGKWIGFSGGITLVDGMPAGASVDGLRLTWYEDGRAPQVNLNGVSVELTVPDVLDFKGSVSYASDQNEFHGSITLNLTALHMEVDGSAVFGTRAGHTYLALYLAAEWPAGVPLFATGLGLYGMAGLLVLNMAPNKLPTEEWYGSDTTPGWYLRSPAGIVQSIGALPAGSQAKWVDQVSATAFGAGVTLGTLGDNGHSFSGRLLLAIVFPGPVLLIEGKASLLQDRARLDKDANFRALAVLDSNAGTFQAHLDARYLYDSSGKLINIRGGAEAFFSLSDASAWHLYLGQKDPQSQRIRAQIFQLFEADAYVMLDSHQLAMGAWVGYNHQWSFGPLSVTLQAWLDSNAVVSWHPVHFHGDLWLHGSVALGAFGFNLGLTVDARLAADVFDPFHILGQFSVSLSLPWPLPSPSATVTMEWGPTPTVPTLPLPLQEVAIEHFKTTASWPLPGGVLLSPPSAPPQTSIPVVPLDCRPHVTFSRPVNDDALVGVNAQPLVPDSERIGDPSQNQGPVTVRYGLQQVALQKLQGISWAPVAQTPPGPNQERLYGSWATVPRMPSGGGANPGQTKLWLWSKSAFDYTRHTSGEWNQWFTDRFSGYPCGPLVQNCWDFEQIAPTTRLPNPWPHPAQPNLVFSNGSGGSMSIVALSQPVEGLTHALCFAPGNVTIHLPEPRNVVKIPALDAYPSYAAFYGYDVQGNAFGPFTKSNNEQKTIEMRGGNMTRIGITSITLANQVGAAIGCAYVPSRNQLLFVEFGSGNLSAIDLSTNRYTVLGTGYLTPEDIVVTADGSTAYITERPGNLLHLDLTKNRLNRSAATIISSGMTAPQQIALDEASNTAYVVEYANPGNLLRINLGSGYAAPMYGSLNNAVGLLLLPGSSTVYITEQGGDVQLSRVTFTPGSDTTHEPILSGLTSPFFMHWGNADHTRILLALRDPANQIVQIDLTQSPVSMTTIVNNVPFRPSSAALLPGNRLVVCSDSAVSGYDLQLCIPQVCVVTADELIQHFEDELDHWSQQGEVLDPYTTYRLQVTTTVSAHGDGDLSWYQPPTQTYTDYAYFRTGGPPTVETLSTPVGYPGTAGPFKSGLDDLTRYVDQAAATPVPGTPGAYSMGVSFNENYIELLYSKAMRDLAIHLNDNNGPARDPSGRLITLGNEWGRVDQLTLTESEISWLATLSQSGCVLVDPQTILHNTRLLSAIDSQVLAPQSLYEARLVPMLLHEDFSGGSFTNPLGTWSAQDTTGTSQWHTGRDGTPPAPFVVQTTTATSTLLWTPNQPGDWADYRLNVYLRATAANPLGVVFRYANSGQYYRFSFEPQSNPAQPPHWRLLKVAPGQTTPYDLPFSATNFVFKTTQDYLITVEALGPTVRVYQDGQLLFTVTDPALGSGSIGLYCANSPNARFTDVRVDDFRATAPVAYRFTFTTS